MNDISMKKLYSMKLKYVGGLVYELLIKKKKNVLSNVNYRFNKFITELNIFFKLKLP